MPNNTEYISLDKIKVQKHNVRIHDIDVGIDDLAANIKANGLLQPIAAYYDSGKEHYVILTGQRRLNAYHRLDESYPGEGYDKIECKIIGEPESDEKKMALSLAENITQLPMTNSDLIKAVTDLYNVYGSYDMVRQEFGITKKMVDKYVRLSRLPQVLKDAIKNGGISSNPKTAENVAIRAVNATNYVKNGSVPEQTVLELAIEMAKGEVDINDLVDEIPKGGTIDDIKGRAQGKPKTNIPIHLSTETAKKLKQVSDSSGEPAALRATQYVVDGVEKDYSQLEQ